MYHHRSCGRIDYKMEYCGTDPKGFAKLQRKKAREMLGKAIKGVVSGKELDCVSIDVFEEGSEEKVRVKLKTSKGVDNSVTEGMAIAMYA